MTRISKPKQRFKEKKDARFKGEQRSLKIEKGTIDKFQQKRAFGSTIAYKATKSSSERFIRKKAKKEDVFQKKKKEKKKAEEAAASQKKGVSKVAKISALQAVDKTLSVVGQDEDNEGFVEAKDAAKKANRTFKATKKVSGYRTKNEKYSKSVTTGKLDDLRFSSKKKKNPPIAQPIKQSKKQRVTTTASKSIRRAIEQGIQKLTTKTATSTPYGWIAMGIAAVLFLIFGILLMSSNQSSADNGSMYVKHWDGEDAYHSSLLAQRYGITAEQIDGFIKNEGYTNVDSRATGKEFLRLQSISGIDVRMLVAFAQMESSYGTAGVAKQFPKANIFGYGAFDNDPNQGASWDNTRAVNEFRSTQIDSFGNRTIAIMDERARAYHSNTLGPGEYVYWTSLDAGKPRAAIAEKLDKWIDDHGGTPDPPGGYGPIGGGGAGLAVLDKLIGQSVSGEFGGETGQCYAVSAYYAHSINSSIILKNGIAASDIGSDYPWASWNWTVVNNPSYKDIRAGDIINFKRGANMGSWTADSDYGHTGVVGKVLGNNQFLFYDQNPGPLKTWTVTYVSGGISSVIHPPK